MADEPEPIEEFIPIPEEFHSFLTGEPFAACSVCDRPLLEDGTTYLIEKAIDRSEVAFEYAICIPCQTGLRQEFSEGSLRVLDNYLGERVDKDGRKARLIEQFGLDHRPWISECVLCKRPWNAVRWKQLIAICDGPDMMFIGAAPLWFCERDIEEIYRALSKKTRDRLGDFFEEIIGMPTDTVDIPLLL